MSSDSTLSITLNLTYDVAFNMLGDKLAVHIGASALLYAALAYFVFDESFFLEDLVEHYPDMDSELSAWIEDFYIAQYDMIEQLRIFYGTSLSTPPCRQYHRKAPYRLLLVIYSAADESIFIGASCDERDSQYGIEWRVPVERSDRVKRYRDELGRAFQVSSRSGTRSSKGSFRSDPFG